jgi:hypothetical protein
MSFLRRDEILGSFKPQELMSLTAQILEILHTQLSRSIEECEAQANPERDVDDQF